MKVALIADIHGNAHALEAVLEDITAQHVDRTLVLGDIVFKGPLPEQCLALVQQMNTVVLQGNIDELVGNGTIQEGFAKSEEHRQAILLEMEWTRARLSHDQLSYLANLPFEYELQLSDKHLLKCVHATPQNVLDIVLPTDSEAGIERMFAGSDANIVAYGHIHQPYVRFVQGKTLLNTGSVGLPFDGDARASYALIEAEGDQLQVSIRRVQYDIEAAIQAFEGTGHPFADSVIEALQQGRRPV